MNTMPARFARRLALLLAAVLFFAALAPALPLAARAEDEAPASESESAVLPAEDPAEPDAEPAQEPEAPPQYFGAGPVEEPEAEAGLAALQNTLEPAAVATKLPTGAVMQIEQFTVPYGGPRYGYGAYGYSSTPTADPYHYAQDAAGNLQLIRVMESEKKLKIYTYDAGFEYLGAKTIEFPAAMPLWGGFYAAPNGTYFIAVGCSNMQEDDTRTVVQILQYDANWNHISTASIKGGVIQGIKGITEPFRAGLCRMALKDNTLLVHMARLMYKSSDGLNHQANLTFSVNLADMSVTIPGYEWVTVEEDGFFYNVYRDFSAYCSHSFNQFVAWSGEGAVYLSHGDAYPRALELNILHSYGSENAGVASMQIFNFQGETGANQTYATLNGMEVGENGILIVGHSEPHDQPVNGFTGSSPGSRVPPAYVQNVYLIHADKVTGVPSFQWLTDYNPEQSSKYKVYEPRITALGGDRYALLFMVEIDGAFQTEYRLLNSAAQVLASKTFKGMNFYASSDPIYYNGKLCWVDYGAGGSPESPVYLYQLDLSNPESPVLPKGLPVNAVKLNKTVQTLAVGKTLKLKAKVSPAIATDKRVTWKSSKKSVATVSSSGVVTARKAGKATITVTSKSGKKVAKCTIYVGAKVKKVTLNKKSAMLLPQQTLALKATFKPKKPANKTITWASSNPEVATVSSKGKVTALAPGKAIITATSQCGKKKGKCTITVNAPPEIPSESLAPNTA